MFSLHFYFLSLLAVGLHIAAGRHLLSFSLMMQRDCVREVELDHVGGAVKTTLEEL